jgi:hypothetical protein
VRRVDPDRARRYLERNAAAGEEQEHARWLASLTPEHRAVHDRGIPCGECVRAGLETFARSLNALRLGSEHG